MMETTNKVNDEGQWRLSDEFVEVMFKVHDHDNDSLFYVPVKGERESFFFTSMCLDDRY